MATPKIYKIEDCKTPHSNHNRHTLMNDHGRAEMEDYDKGEHYTKGQL